MTDYQVYVLSKGEKLITGLVIVLLLAGISMLFFQSILLVLILPFIIRKGWLLYGEYCRMKRQKVLLREFRDFLFSLSSSFTTGRYMTEAMKEAGTALYFIYGEKSLLGKELDCMVKAIEETGQCDSKVFAEFANRTGLEDIQMLSEVYIACRDTGGNLVTAVNNAAVLLTEKISLEMEIQTMLSQKRLEGTIIAVMPVAMLLFLLWMSPDYLTPMYENITGRLSMAVALMLNVFAYIWMEKMTNVKF